MMPERGYPPLHRGARGNPAGFGPKSSGWGALRTRGQGGFPSPRPAPALNLPLPKHPRPGGRGGSGRAYAEDSAKSAPGGFSSRGGPVAGGGEVCSRLPRPPGPLPPPSEDAAARGRPDTPPHRGGLQPPPQHCVASRVLGLWQTGLPHHHQPPRRSVLRDGGLRGAKCRGNGSIFLSVDENRSVQKFLL